MMNVVLSVPELTVWLVGVEVIVNGTTPVPARPTDWGLPGALSVITSVLLTTPSPVGVNVTLIVQLAPAATELAQVFVSAKPAPTAMLVTLRVALPGFVK